MRSIEMKEIRIPSDLDRDSRTSWPFALFMGAIAAVFVAVMTFFALNAIGIAVLSIAGAMRHQSVDLSIAYKYIAAPTAVVLLPAYWIGTAIYLRRDRKR